MQRSSDLTTQAAAELRRSQIKMTDLSQIKILCPDLKKAFQKSNQQEVKQCVTMYHYSKEKIATNHSCDTIQYKEGIIFPFIIWKKAYLQLI